MMISPQKKEEQGDINNQITLKQNNIGGRGKLQTLTFRGHYMTPNQTMHMFLEKSLKIIIDLHCLITPNG